MQCCGVKNMVVFGQEITKEDMPSYENFVNAPSHMYSAMQDLLNNGLNQNQQQNQQNGLQVALQPAEKNKGAWK